MGTWNAAQCSQQQHLFLSQKGSDATVKRLRFFLSFYFFFGGHQANIGDTRTILHEKVSLIPLPRIFFVRKNAIWAADRWAWNCFFLTILHWGDAKKLGSFDFILYSHFRWHLVHSKVFETRLFSIKNCPKVDFRSPSNKPNFEPHPLFFLSSLPRAGWLIWYRTITWYIWTEDKICCEKKQNKVHMILCRKVIWNMSIHSTLFNILYH